MAIKVSTDKELDNLLSTPINKLHLTIKDSILEKHINQLYSELALHTISFRPQCYLSDEWGAPHGTPLIGIPFYLADETLTSMEGTYTSVEAENEKEVMMYLRHETGHALNYAYQLYEQPQWENIFGSFSRPYKERYQWIPHHKSFVVHLPEWYAQKHPDEDFAETFAVWLTPKTDWQKTYKDSVALMKLEYVDTLIKGIGNKLPVVSKGDPDMPIEDMTMTLREWYDSQK